MLGTETPLGWADDVCNGNGDGAKSACEGGAKQNMRLRLWEVREGVEQGMGCVGVEKGRKGFLGAFGWG